MVKNIQDLVLRYLNLNLDPGIYLWYKPREVINLAVPQWSHVGNDNYHLKSNEITIYDRIKTEIS